MLLGLKMRGQRPGVHVLGWFNKTVFQSPGMLSEGSQCQEGSNLAFQTIDETKQEGTSTTDTADSTCASETLGS